MIEKNQGLKTPLKQKNKLLVLHLVIITLSNYLVQFPLEFFGVTSTWGMFTFPILILASDLTVRLSDSHVARSIVRSAYLPALLISVCLCGFRIGVASATAYLMGQVLDIFAFQKIRNLSNRWWVAPFASTTVSNLFDTYLFFWLSFYQSSDLFMRAHWLQIAHTDLAFKVVISTFVFLPIYGVLLNFLLKGFK